MGDSGFSAHTMFGSTDRAGGVPGALAPSDALALSDGPVYLEGRLVLSLSFQGGPVGELPIGRGDLLERYRLWDDVASAWHGDGLEVLRFEYEDVVVRLGRRPAVLWAGAVDTRARAILEPDLDGAGMAANQRCDLSWKLA